MAQSKIASLSDGRKPAAFGQRATIGLVGWIGYRASKVALNQILRTPSLILSGAPNYLPDKMKLRTMTVRPNKAHRNALLLEADAATVPIKAQIVIE
jgi:hypothetical protein